MLRAGHLPLQEGNASVDVVLDILLDVDIHLAVGPSLLQNIQIRRDMSASVEVRGGVEPSARVSSSFLHEGASSRLVAWDVSNRVLAPSSEPLACVLVVGASEVEDGAFNGSPPSLPKASKISIVDGCLKERSSNLQCRVHDLAELVIESCSFVVVSFAGPFEAVSGEVLDVLRRGLSVNSAAHSLRDLGDVVDIRIKQLVVT